MESTDVNQPQNIPTNTSSQSKKWLAPVLAVVLVLVIGAAAFLFFRNKDQNVEAAVTAGTVQITNSAFSPSTITIKKNQSVTWTNGDVAAHQVASDPYPSHDILPALMSKALNRGDTYTFTFEKTGTFTYHDPLNPAALKGTVIVE